MRMLDVGIGPGGVSAFLHSKGVQVSGLDASYDSLLMSRNLLGPSVPLYVADAQRLPFREEYDIVGAFDVLEHLEDDSGALRRFLDALKPGGHLVVTVPSDPLLYSCYDEVFGHYRRYTKVRLQRILRNAGFSLVRTRCFYSWLWIPKAIQRVRRGGLAAEQKVKMAMEDLAWVPAPPWNGAFLALQRMENALSNAGLSPPCGSSIFASASRPGH